MPPGSTKTEFNSIPNVTFNSLKEVYKEKVENAVKKSLSFDCSQCGEKTVIIIINL